MPNKQTILETYSLGYTYKILDGFLSYLCFMVSAGTGLSRKARTDTRFFNKSISGIAA